MECDQCDLYFKTSDQLENHHCENTVLSLIDGSSNAAKVLTERIDALASASGDSSMGTFLTEAVIELKKAQSSSPLLRARIREGFSERWDEIDASIFAEDLAWQPIFAVGICALAQAILEPEFILDYDSSEDFLDHFDYTIFTYEAGVQNKLWYGKESANSPHELSAICPILKWAYSALKVLENDREQALIYLGEMLDAASTSNLLGPSSSSDTALRVAMRSGYSLIFHFLATSSEDQEFFEGHDWEGEFQPGERRVEASRHCRELAGISGAKEFPLSVGNSGCAFFAKKISIDGWHFGLTELGLLMTSSRADRSGETNPQSAAPYSTQGLAWRLGAMAADFVTHAPQNRDLIELMHHCHTATNHPGAIHEPTTQATHWMVIREIASLAHLYESNELADLSNLRANYLVAYQQSFAADEVQWGRINRESDAYWAIRLGFLDRLATLDNSGAPTSNLLDSPLDPIEVDVDVAKLTFLRSERHYYEQMQLMAEIKDGLPAPDKEIMGEILENLGPYYNEASEEVIQDLKKAERLFRADGDYVDCRLAYYKAIEGSFKDCFVWPFQEFAKKNNWRYVYLPPTPHEERQRTNAERPKKTMSQLDHLQLSDWANVLMQSSESLLESSDSTAYGSFLKDLVPNHKFPDTRLLASRLLKAQEARGAAAHAQRAESRYAAGRGQRDLLRDYALGVNGSSLIVDIYKMFGKPPTSS